MNNEWRALSLDEIRERMRKEAYPAEAFDALVHLLIKMPPEYADNISAYYPTVAAMEEWVESKAG